MTAFGDWLEPVIYSFAGDLRWHNFPRYTSAHKCGSKHIFWGGRICARISPNFPEKLFCKVCLQIFSHKDYEDLFLVWAPKQRFQVFFCKRWAPFFLEFSGILPRYLGILFGFSTNPHFWGCACTPCTPVSYTAASAIHSIAADRSTNLSIGRHATIETWSELSGRVPASQLESWEEWFAVVLRGQEHSPQRPWQLSGSTRQSINLICLSEKTTLKISKIITRATFCKFFTAS